MNIAVDLWFESFKVKLQERIPRSDWPPDDSEYWATFRGALIRHGIASDIAEIASYRLAENPPPFPDKALERFIMEAKEAWRERDALEKGTTPDSHEEALRLSVGCRDCTGIGLTSRYDHRTYEDGRPYPSFSCYCTCPMGLWVKAKTVEKSPEVHRKITDLSHRPDLRMDFVPWAEHPDNRYRYPGIAWNDLDDEPYRVLSYTGQTLSLGINDRRGRYMPDLAPKRIAAEKPERTLAAPLNAAVPEGVNPEQEWLLLAIGDSWRSLFNAMPRICRAEVLALASPDITDATIDHAKALIRRHRPVTV